MIGADRRPRSASARRAALAGLALLFAGFIALAAWQVERRTWKLALIDRVETRLHAAPVAAPDASVARDRLAADWDYRRVVATGRYATGRDSYVQAVTELGPGFWVLTPLQRPGGGTVLVNRGFVAARPAASASPAEQSVTGLVRLSEPRGGFLRDNDPPGDRWYSRDVDAIAAARGLSHVAPYFIDADATPAADSGASAPVGGLTVVRFANNHLVYAVTWSVLAALCLAAAVPVLRDRR